MGVLLTTLGDFLNGAGKIQYRHRAKYPRSIRTTATTTA
jgi:hypothetical protein